MFISVPKHVYTCCTLCRSSFAQKFLRRRYVPRRVYTCLGHQSVARAPLRRSRSSGSSRGGGGAGAGGDMMMMYSSSRPLFCSSLSTSIVSANTVVERGVYCMLSCLVFPTPRISWLLFLLRPPPRTPHILLVLLAAPRRLIKYFSIEFFDLDLYFIIYFKHTDFRLLMRSVQIHREIKNWECQS